MPRIDLIPEESCYYNALDPYYVDYDNQPLRNIIARQKLINTVVDRNDLDLANAKGTTGSLAERLSSSLEDDGYLKASAVDLSLHTMDAHTDTVNYVRMTADERDKLALIADEAKNISLEFETAGISNIPVDIDNGVVIFADSVSTSWRWETGKVYLDLNFPLEAAHSHFYDQAPTNPLGDFQTYYAPYDFIDGSLRVYINGSRVSQDESYHPGATPTSSWVLNKLSSVNYITKQFVLMTAITAYDLITVDFDRPYL